jgi:hypothetical protein
LNYPDVQYLCRHAIETLPDSIQARRRVLQSVVAVLKTTDPIRVIAQTIDQHMDAADAEQRDLPNIDDSKGDGHHRKGGDGQ